MKTTAAGKTARQVNEKRKGRKTMGKKTFYVIEERSPETGKTIAHAEKVCNCFNLLGYFTPRKGLEIVSINACDTWKEAEKIAAFWNQCAREKGFYLFS